MRHASPYTLFAFCLLVILAAGCAGKSGAGNQTNSTQPQGNATANASTNITSVQGNLSNGTTSKTGQEGWPTYSTGQFSFEYLPTLNLSEAKNGDNGIISGSYQLPERTGELMAVRYIDTLETFGKNKDDSFKADPTEAASGFLSADRSNDSMGFINQDGSRVTGNMSTYTLGTEAYVAELPFELVMDPGTVYTGYALSVYDPQRSLWIDVRVLALDSDIAAQMKQNFLLSFRMG